MPGPGARRRRLATRAAARRPCLIQRFVLSMSAASLRRETVCGVCHSPPARFARPPEGDRPPLAEGSCQSNPGSLAGPAPRGRSRSRTGFVYRPTTELSKSPGLSARGRGSLGSPAPHPRDGGGETTPPGLRRPGGRPLRSIVEGEGVQPAVEPSEGAVVRPSPVGGDAHDPSRGRWRPGGNHRVSSRGRFSKYP